MSFFENLIHKILIFTNEVVHQVFNIQSINKVVKEISVVRERKMSERDNVQMLLLFAQHTRYKTI